MNVNLNQLGDSFIISPRICNAGPYSCAASEMSFSVPAGLEVISADTKGVGSYDPVSSTWRVGVLPAPTGDGNRCLQIDLKLKLTSIDTLPLTVQANVDSDCVEDVIDNAGSWVVSTFSTPVGGGDAQLDLPDDEIYTLADSGIIAYIVYEPLTTDNLEIGTQSGGNQILNLAVTNLATKTISLGYYTGSEQDIYFTGNGTITIYLQ